IFTRAAVYLREAAEKLGDNPVVHYHLGMALAKGGDKAGGARSLEHALSLSSTFDGAEEARKMLKELKQA
ncbi:MAG: hypothetical protein DRH04_10410, partial [Deltaproteobacteria bacterium]